MRRPHRGGTMVAEVLVVGAGIVGCSVAYHLAKLGCRDVMVLERDTVGSGSTGVCAGGIRQQFSSEINIRLSVESLNFLKRLEEETGYDPELRQHGYLILATDEGQLEAFRRSVELQRSLGVEVDILPPEEARKLVPGLNVEDVLGATYCPSDGYADPHSAVQGLAEAARRLGVRIFQGTEVRGIKVEGDRVAGVVTDDGEFHAPVVVDAAGPWAGVVAKMAGLDLPVRPSRRHIFSTEPAFSSPDPFPMVVDFGNGFWFRREGPCIIFGMRNPEEPEGFDTTVDWDFLAGPLAEAACRRVPFIADLGIRGGQAGLHLDTPDKNAILGQSELEGFYLACGFSGHGFMHAPAVGRVLAELIISGGTELNISPLSPGRFREKRQAGEEYFI